MVASSPATATPTPTGSPAVGWTATRTAEALAAAPMPVTAHATLARDRRLARSRWPGCGRDLSNISSLLCCPGVWGEALNSFRKPEPLAVAPGRNEGGP